MEQSPVTFSFFLIFTGAAAVASLALYTRQPLLIAYIVLGALIGPYGLALITNLTLLQDIAHVGIIFLLFLLGLDMQPRALLTTMRNSTLVALASALCFALIGAGVAYAFGFSRTEALITGLAMMFSSTIIGIKLLPTTVLHHRHTGELMVGLLLLQDMIAILVLVALLGSRSGDFEGGALLLSLLALPLLIALAVVFVRLVLMRLIQRFDRFHEYIFLLAIGWCLGLAELAALMKLSPEIGAFVAGVSIASSPISQYIAISLKPLRDFFLILFFFSLGGSFDLGVLGSIYVAAIVLSLLMLAAKPLVFRFLLGRLSETPALAWDVGLRLGQNSEFSLLIAYMAAGFGMIGKEASHLIQATAIITFVASSYIVVLNCPNPIAISDRLRRD
ncbi:MAG: cation:proton antiporter [Gammaproteobacteria bacterium]|nr:cation:proton antiporter [Gammaproteobacteria bacterium]MBP6481012.1 cation:proton antiporter [Pseudomonadales bacterium]MBK8991251.1 cation:proton antiporter [Gammaproteobacteria bacterium]MBK9467733.1 cation:proton antiporter [Gammaproteobacteria bacterium]MBP7910088.1 cation:proton antiporter [Pseudomonadales bacterium]